IIVPRFVLAELQLLADSSDRMKRARGRRGLDIVTRLQKAPRLDVSIDDFATAGKGVDTALVEVAHALNAVIVTTDTGLARVAKIQSIPILNVNDLANSLKPNVIPGEALALQVMKQGEQAGQGVGYLDDGTMVVVEDGAKWIGQHVTISVTSSMQTSAGRLIFGRVGDVAAPGPQPTTVGVPSAADDDDGPLGPGAGEGARPRPSRRNPRRG
ncbi:MAG: PIN/TRAM domain-containing protein, partial [Phycisphaerales bacterium]